MKGHIVWKDNFQNYWRSFSAQQPLQQRPRGRARWRRGAQRQQDSTGLTKVAAVSNASENYGDGEASDWTKPAAIHPKKIFREQGRYSPLFKTPANYGFTIIAKIKPGREEAVRQYGKTIENAVAGDPFVLAPIRLHYLRWVMFNVGSDTYFMYQGIFDTDFDKYTEDAIALFTKTGVDTVFENLEGFPTDWQTNAPAFVKFVREHQCPSFLEYGEYPFVSADEIKKALKLKATFSTMLDQMQ
jgi:hypothetical protein